MTTLALKTGSARKVIASAAAVLGTHTIKSGRFWYKGQQNCDLVFLQCGRETIVHASGGVRFRVAVKQLDDGEAAGSLSLLGWLRETPNSIRIITSLLAIHSKEVLRRRELRLALETAALEDGLGTLELNEAMGAHFSIKADEDKIEEKYRIADEESDRNFAMAVKSRWYHQGFVNFCRGQGIKCYYRSVFSEPLHARPQEALAPSSWVETVH